MSTDQPDELFGSLDNLDDATIEHAANLNRIDRELSQLIGDADNPPSMAEMHRALQLLLERQKVQNRWLLQRHTLVTTLMANQAEHNTQAFKYLLSRLDPETPDTSDEP